MSVPYYKPPQPDESLLRSLVRQVAVSGVLTDGPLCRDLEDRLKTMHDVTYALACSSGTMGLALALQALRKLTEASTVYTPAFTWSSTLWAARAALLNVIFADIDRDTWLMSRAGEKNEIAMPVATFGAAIDASHYKGHVLVDAAHALGTKMSLGEVAGAIISFSPTKLLTACEGGVLLTNDSALASEFSELRRSYGRMSELNAAMALSQWGGLDVYARDRRLRWQKYVEVLGPQGWRAQRLKESNYSTAAFLAEDRDAVLAKLTGKEIETRIYYKPLVEHEKLAHTNLVYKHILCLPNWFKAPTGTVLDALK